MYKYFLTSRVCEFLQVHGGKPDEVHGRPQNFPLQLRCAFQAPPLRLRRSPRTGRLNIKWYRFSGNNSIVLTMLNAIAYNYFLEMIDDRTFLDSKKNGKVQIHVS